MIRNLRVALLLTGSAACVFACGGKHQEAEESLEGLMTQRAENLKMVESTNGKLSYRFQAQLMETYEYDREPFREFRKGIFVETFSDSTNTVETTLVGDYAIHYMERSLWEVKGNVVATNANGQKLETQQLFWNQRTERIYSNVDSKLTQGNDVIIGVGFESDEQFVDWEFRRPRGTVEFDVEAVRGEDETPGDDDPSQDGPGSPVGAAVEAGIDAGGVADALENAFQQEEPGSPSPDDRDAAPSEPTPPQPAEAQPAATNDRSHRTGDRGSTGSDGTAPRSTGTGAGRVRSDRLRGADGQVNPEGVTVERIELEGLERTPLTASPDGAPLTDAPLNRN